MTVDLTPVVQALLALLAAAMTAAVPYVVLLIRQRLHIELTDQQQATITAAAQLGAKAAYGFLARQGATIGQADVRNAALAHGANTAIAALGPMLTLAGITPDAVAALVEHEFSGLLVTDPNVSIARPAMPAPSLVAAAA